MFFNKKSDSLGFVLMAREGYFVLEYTDNMGSHMWREVDGSNRFFTPLIFKTLKDGQVKVVLKPPQEVANRRLQSLTFSSPFLTDSCRAPNSVGGSFYSCQILLHACNTLRAIRDAIRTLLTEKSTTNQILQDGRGQKKSHKPIG